MIPNLVTVRRRRPSGRWRRLYIPVLPALVVLSPLLLLAVSAGVVACIVFRVSPVGVLCGIGRLLWALPGTRFNIEYGGTAVQVSVR